MPKSSLNHGWAVRAKVSAFAELSGAGGEWSDVTLPHDALITAPRTPDAAGGAASGYFPGGAFEYHTDIVVAEQDRGKLVILEFDGVHRDAMVYVNGALAGQHAFGYSRFTVRIDPYLRFGGANEIRVTCTAHQDSRWYTGAGIYRDVNLIIKNPIHIAVDGVRIVTDEIEADLASVEVIAEVVNAGLVTASVAFVSSLGEEGVEVAGDQSTVTLLPGTTATVRHRLHVKNPALWHPESPSLYTCVAQVREDDDLLDMETVPFGIRKVQVDSRRGLRINGEAVKLRGASVHHDNGPLGAVSIAAAEERRVRLLKEAGFNAIRSSHNPASTALIQACDRLGMLVVDEAFDVWTSSKSDFDYASSFTQWWERDLEALVAKDVNHPSVIMYSIGNEIPETGTPDGGVWSRRLAEKLRTLDPTRPITNGINGFVSSLDLVIAGMKQSSAAQDPAGVNGMMTQVDEMMNQISASDMVTSRTEESFSVLDVAGINYGDARYERDRVLFPNRVILGTESFPAQIARIWQLVTSNDHVIGDFTWTGWDYLGEAGLGSVGYAAPGELAAPAVAQPYPWLTAWCGDIDIIGERRPASFYREIVFGLRAEPYIAVQRPGRYSQSPLSTPWSWSDVVAGWSWPDHEGSPVRVEVYAAADEVELVLNGTTVGRSVVGSHMPFRADFDTVYEAGELNAIAYVNGREQGRTTLVSAAPTLRIDAQADRSQLDADRQDLAFIRIALTDEHGIVHLDHDRAVTVTVTGAGDLHALGSAAPSTEEDFGGPRRTTFDGRALAIVRPQGEGAIHVTIAAAGCERAQLELYALQSDAVTQDAFQVC